MNTISYDSFKNILSFLEPLDLCETRTLNRECHSITDQFLEKTYDTVNLNNYACPSCGCYYVSNNERNEINHSYFYDLPYGDPYEEEDRMKSVQRVYRFNEVRRFQLVCDTCEGKEIDIDYRNYVKNVNGVRKHIFPYGGDRQYEIRVFGRGTNNPWMAALYHTYSSYSNDMEGSAYDDNDTILWNEIRSFIENMPIYVI